MNSRTLYLLGLVLIVAVGCSSSDGDTIAASGRQSYLYCRECGYERVCAPGEESSRMFCPRCAAGSEALTLTDHSHHGGASWFRAAVLVPVGLVSGTGILGGWFFYSWWKAEHKRRGAEPVYNFACPFCQKKLHYRGARAGHKGACPRCRQMLTFPSAPSPNKHS
jgi:hypothetical protein